MSGAAACPPDARARILHVVDSLGSGGTELVSVALIRDTASRFRHAICSLRGAGAAAGTIDGLAVPITCLGKREGHDWGLALRIARLCRQLRPQVVHARNWGTIDAVIGARLARVPVVIQSEHGRDVGDLDGLRRGRLRVRRLLAPFIDLHVVVSMHLQQWLLERVGIRPEKVRVVCNGVDTARFGPLPDRDGVRAALGVGPTALVFGAVGRLTPVKDYGALLEAFAAVSAHAPQSRLIVVGEGPQRPVLEAQVRRRGLLDRVRLVGHREDVAQWLGIMDVFVHPSLIEGMSNAVLEAMAVGLPVVATAVGGTPEVVDHGVTGILVPAATPTALSAAMRAYADNPSLRTAHGTAARARVEGHYSRAKMIAGYTEVYCEALARRDRALGRYAPRAAAD